MSDTDLMALSEPRKMLTDPDAYAAFLDQLRDMAKEFAGTATTKTEAGRKAIRSMAYKVTRSKTAIDEAGKEMNASARAAIKKVDTVRKAIKEDLEEIAAQIRLPLTTWERAEAERQLQVDTHFDRLDKLRVVPAGATSAQVSEALREAEELRAALSEDVFRDQAEHAAQVADLTVLQLKESLAAVVKAERDAAELEELRQIKAERDALLAEKAAREDEASAPPPKPATEAQPGPRDTKARTEQSAAPDTRPPAKLVIQDWLVGKGVATPLAATVAAGIVMGQCPRVLVD